MYVIALIQNQSEMAHYGYADARPLLSELNYKSILYTADNIDNLSHDLNRKTFDAVIFASNALNDKIIRNTTMTESFRKILDKSLSEGLGLLILHQLKLAQIQDSNLAFLPSTLNEILAVVRPKNEKFAEGSIDFLGSSQNHITLLYPNRIDTVELRQHAIGFKSLRGLYWHYWDNINLSEWDTLFVDNSYEPENRAILLVTKESSDKRIVISSLTLDWQKQRPLLANLLTYVIEGRHNTAVLSDEKKADTAFDYLIRTIESRKFPFQKYFAGDSLDFLKKNLKDGVHTTLLLGPYVDPAKLDAEFNLTIRNLVMNGQLKLLSIEKEGDQFRRFSLSGRERFAYRLLQDVELKIQAELKSGYVDGSFWSTAETLKTVESLDQKSANYNELVDSALDEARKDHDREGSYDEVFGVTCAFYWMRAFYLGTKSEYSKATESWIRNNISNYEIREQALAYTTFSELGTLIPNDKNSLVLILDHLSIEQLSEIDLIVFLKAALTIKHYKIMPALVTNLNNNQNTEGAWVDLATTATATSLLIDTLEALKKDSPIYNKVKPDIEKMIFKSVIHIQESYERSALNLKPNGYPWDGKASTTIKCLQAWLKFDELLDLPVYEIVEALSRFNFQSNNFSSGKTALAVLEDMKIENKSLLEKFSELKILKEKYKANKTKLKETLNSKRKMSIILFLSLYTFLTTIIGIIKTFQLKGLADVLNKCIINSWGYHLTFLAAAGSILAAIYVPFIRKKLGIEKDED